MKLTRILFLIAALAAILVLPGSASAVTPQISTNYYQSCVLSDAGAVSCAGEASSLIFGSPPPPSGYVESYVPGPASLTGVTQLASGETHVCALLVDTTVKCWGDNASYQLGQGGIGTTDSATPLTVKANPTGDLSGVTQIATQDDTTCALKSNGTAWCWGEGSDGQLGDGGTTDLSLATEVFGLTGVSKVVPGSDATCAIVSGGGVKCWGSDSSGALGNGADGDSSSPMDVVGVSGAVDLGAGTNFACALISDGTVKCWGSDGAGQQGNGPGGANQTAATVPGVSGVAQLAVGYNSVCVLKTDASVYCWGYNNDHQITPASTSNVEDPTNIPGAAGAIFLAQQYDETVCAAFRGGGVKCWGVNDNAQAGIPNSRADIAVPTDVPGVDIVTLAYPGTGTTLTAPAKTKLDKKKKTYTLTTQLTTTPNLLVSPAEACTGLTTASVKYSYTIKKKHKKVKKKKTVKKNGVLVVSGANCASTIALKLPVKYFNGKKAKVTFTAAGNGSLQPVSATAKFKLPKVKVKKKK